jgi:hypothetical protein
MEGRQGKEEIITAPTSGISGRNHPTGKGFLLFPDRFCGIFLS